MSPAEIILFWLVGLPWLLLVLFVYGLAAWWFFEGMWK